MNKILKKISVLGLLLLLALSLCVPALAAGEEAVGVEPVTVESEAALEVSSSNWKSIASAVAIGLAAMGGAIGMGIATGKAAESVGRQPEAEGKIRTTFMLGLVFIETAIIYALLVVIIIIFVL